jgi:hypothetical protein
LKLELELEGHAASRRGPENRESKPVSDV